MMNLEIFTIGGSSNEWKKIPGPWKDKDQRLSVLKYSEWSDPVSINGRFLHWNVSSSKYTVSMDVSQEKYMKLKHPPTGERIENKSYHLVDLREHLSFITKDFTEIIIARFHRNYPSWWYQ